MQSPVREIFAIWIGMPVATEALVCARQWQELPFFTIHQKRAHTMNQLRVLYTLYHFRPSTLGMVVDLSCWALCYLVGRGSWSQDIAGQTQKRTWGWLLERRSPWSIRCWRGKGTSMCLAVGTTAADAPGVWAYACMGREGSEEQDFWTPSRGDIEKRWTWLGACSLVEIRKFFLL